MSHVSSFPANLSPAFPAQMDAVQLFASDEPCSSDVFSFAPCVADVTAGTVALLDDDLKIMITAATQSLEGISLERRSWETIVASMMKNPFLELDGHEINQTFRLAKEGASFFKFGHSSAKSSAPNEADLKQWISGFVGSIQEPDLLYPMSVFVDGLAKTASAALTSTTQSTRIESPQSGDSRPNQRVVADIGVLRYPTLQSPYLRLYRVKLILWSSVERTITGPSNRKTGITAEHCFRRFKPRKALISDIPVEIKETAIAGAAVLFGTDSRASGFDYYEKVEKESSEDPKVSRPTSIFKPFANFLRVNYATFFSSNQT